MKSLIAPILLLILLSFSIYIPFEWVLNLNSTRMESIGPHDPELLLTLSTVKFFAPGTYTFSGNRYFELQNLENDELVRSVGEDPAIGEKYGEFWIRDHTFNGSWKMLGGAEVFSPWTQIISITPSVFTKFTNVVMGLGLALVLVVLSLALTFRVAYWL